MPGCLSYLLHPVASRPGDPIPAHVWLLFWFSSDIIAVIRLCDVDRTVKSGVS